MRVGPIRFDSASGEVFREGQPAIRLEPQPAAVLARLAATPGELVTHEALRSAVWGDAVHVDFRQGLHYAIRQVRRALGDTDRSSPLIETIPRRGYRLRAVVTPTLSPALVRSRDQGPMPRWGVWAGLTVALLVGADAVDRRHNEHHRMAMSVLRTLHDLIY